MKKKLVILGLLAVVILLTGCRQKEVEEVDVYRLKQIYAGSFCQVEEVYGCKRFYTLMDGQTASNNGLEKNPKFMRDLAFAWGEGDIRYHVDLPGDERYMVSETFSATLMVGYSYSYIINAPVKLISNIRYNFSLLDGLPEEEVGVVEKSITVGTAILFTLFDLFHLFVGLVFSVVFGILGILFGFITSPLQTIFDILPVLWKMVMTSIYAVLNFFF
jgi:hypothetical protein